MGPVLVASGNPQLCGVCAQSVGVELLLPVGGVPLPRVEAPLVVGVIWGGVVGWFDCAVDGLVLTVVCLDPPGVVLLDGEEAAELGGFFAAV